MTTSSAAARSYPGATPRAELIRAAFRLEWFTVAWMVVEAVVALASGLMARSISLTAFGVDSLIELASAGVLIWRLTVELRRGQSFRGNDRARGEPYQWGAAVCARGLCRGGTGWSLWTREGAEFSWPGLLVSLTAIPLMWVLSRRKLGVADSLGSRACAPTQSRASPAGGCPWSWWLGFLPSSRSARGGLMPLPRLGSCGCWSRKAARLGRRRTTTIDRSTAHVISSRKRPRLRKRISSGRRAMSSTQQVLAADRDID